MSPASRSRERHNFWPAFVAALIGVILLVCGARHTTAVDTKDGDLATETQLVKAFSSGGLQYASQLPPPSPPKGDDPVALERWARQNAHPEAPAWKVRVDTAAAAACPT
jgi:hypothetical protein